MKQKIHPAWIIAGVTFFTLFATAGFRSAPSVLILPLEEMFCFMDLLRHLLLH
jgi:hypothetical protein